MVFVCQGRPYISTEGALVRHVAERFSWGRRPAGACMDGLLHGGDVDPVRVRLGPAQPLMRKEDEDLAARRSVSHIGHRVINDDIVAKLLDSPQCP